MLQTPLLVMSHDPHMRQLLYNILHRAGYVVHVHPGSATSPTALVVEHIENQLHIYPCQPTPKERARAAKLVAHPLNVIDLLAILAKRAMEARREATSSVHTAPICPAAIIHGPGSPMIAVHDLIRLYGPLPDSVLVTGETGTGKELVVRALHAASPRADKPLLMLNCAALPELLLESELFGHQKGAFTGAIVTKPGMLEQAHHGTVVLDEINSMPVPLQAKLLRFLQHGEVRRVGDNHTGHVDVRVLATTNQPLPELIAEKRFRADLFYRLAVFAIEVPPLRARLMDVAPLVEHFCRGRLNHHDEIHLPESHNWPGNVRELENHVRRALVHLTIQL